MKRVSKNLCKCSHYAGWHRNKVTEIKGEKWYSMTPECVIKFCGCNVYRQIDTLEWVALHAKV